MLVAVSGSDPYNRLLSDSSAWIAYANRIPNVDNAKIFRKNKDIDSRTPGFCGIRKNCLTASLFLSTIPGEVCDGSPSSTTNDRS